ncbi:MAG TPA: BON domain-containing protein [Pseudoalteromonas prydzensis]|uniref:BON domain-containing protein n=2 Tax=Pseudoalteromonas prydzensis TaxID=182141 RepID=A0A7V1D2M9_9GAMM|nr:BON domain-containing protein [Pseudoalteromonas prydzensis]
MEKYMKTDSQLRDDVLSELRWRPNIDAAHIGVTAKDGVITLTGQVAHFTQRSAAVSAAESVLGVSAIANEIEVEILGLHKRNDSDIAAAAANALLWSFEVPHDKITVIVKQGKVTLDGSVDWQYQKNAAERSVENLMGVTGVTNAITIKPSVKWVDIKSKIEDAFKRNADIEPRRITVRTNHDAVTLSGSVASVGERTQALRATWAAPGVRSVINNLTIVP